MLGVINVSNINNVNSYKVQIPFISYPTYLWTYTSVRLASCIVYIQAHGSAAGQVLYLSLVSCPREDLMGHGAKWFLF